MVVQWVQQFVSGVKSAGMQPNKTGSHCYVAIMTTMSNDTDVFWS